MKIKYAIGILLITLLAGCGAKKTDKAESKNPRTPADYVEQASFTTLDGDSVTVADYKGKVVMIDFWETWCGPCVSSFPGIQKLTKEFPDDFVVLAVTPGFSDTKAKAQQFVKNHDYDFTYLYDANGLHKRLNVPGIPFKAFISADGNFITTKMGSAGPKGDYEHIKSIIEKYEASALPQNKSK